MMDSEVQNEVNPFLPRSLLVMVFITTTERSLGQHLKGVILNLFKWNMMISNYLFFFHISENYLASHQFLKPKVGRAGYTQGIWKETRSGLRESQDTKSISHLNSERTIRHWRNCSLAFHRNHSEKHTSFGSMFQQRKTWEMNPKFIIHGQEKFQEEVRWPTGDWILEQGSAGYVQRPRIEDYVQGLTKDQTLRPETRSKIHS